LIDVTDALIVKDNRVKD